MVLHIGECVLGVFAFDERGDLVAYERFPQDPGEIAGRLATIEMGIPTPEHRALIGKLIERGEREFVLESAKLVERLREEFEKAEFAHQIPNRAGSILRDRLADIAEELGVRQVDELRREVSFVLTRIKIKREAGQRDRLVIHAIDMVDELDRFINILTIRVREWYGRHFPELDRLVPDHELYLKFVHELGPRSEFSESRVKAVGDLPRERARRIAEAARSSVGAALSEADIRPIKQCVEQIRKLQRLREELVEYVDSVMAEVAPNVRTLVGGSIGARLISLAGGLESLSRLPASTIQVLGAEKALFRALKGKAKPPKHGVIYQHPAVRGAPRRLRGKIARALAVKIAIAARVDTMAGSFVGEKLLAEFKARVSEILNQ
jgi:nucleolar protein 56